MIFLKELRKAYPTMSMLRFAEIYEGHRESDELFEIFDRAEKEAVAEKEEGERKIKELGHQLSVGEQHRLLHFVVPADVDLEHTQAILAYGFLMPGSGRVFSGTHVIPERYVRKNTANKLGIRFSRAKYDTALEYLKREGVIAVSERRKSEDEALALRPSTSVKGVKPHGEQVLRVALEFAAKRRC